MERKSGYYLTGCTVILLAGVVSAGAQTPQGQPPTGSPGENGQRAPGRQPGPGDFGEGGQQPPPNGFRGGGQQQGPGRFGGDGQNRFPGGPGGMQGGMMKPMPNMPEMAKKMQSIMALRQINGVGLTARDISTALPILRTMRDAEKALETRSLQILEEEKRALLAAQPGAPLPPDSGQRMQEASEVYHQQMARSWEAITKGIGPEKAGGIRGLVEGGMMRPGGGNPMPPGQGQPGPFNNRRGQPGGGPNDGGRADRQQPQPPEDEGGFGPGPQGPPPGGDVGFGGQDGGQGQFGGNRGQQGQPFPRQGPNGPNQGRPGMVPGGARISLTDLVELLEQKLVAMRK